MLVWDRTSANWSMPMEMCSACTLCRSRISRTSRNVSLDPLIRFETVRIMKFLFPEIPVMKRSWSNSFPPALSTIIVPGCDGSFVLRMFRGIPISLTGATESSWSTDAPMYASSRSSANVISEIGLGLSTMRGSAMRIPDTSVQFS